MLIFRWAVLALLAVMALIVAGVSVLLHGHSTGWLIAKQPLEAWQDALAPHLMVVRPSSTGPDGAPVLLIFSGCGGVSEHLRGWAELGAEEGFLSVIVDSFTPRDISRDEAIATVCEGSSFWGRERAGDVAAMLAMTRRMNGADPSRVVLLGQSHGAWAIMDLMAMDLARKGPTNVWPRVEPGLRDGVVGTALFYPYCGVFSLSASRGWQHQPRSLLLLAQDDTVTSPLACLEAADVLQAAGVEMSVTQFPGVDHAFDQTIFPPDSRLSHDPDATRVAREQVRAWLRSSVSP